MREEKRRGKVGEVAARNGRARRLVEGGVPGEIFPMTIEERLAKYLGAEPARGDGVWVAPGATVCGDVRLGAEASVFYGAVLRGDLHTIEIGPRSNLQDNVVVHVADAHGVRVGADVTVGHAAVLHACEIGDGCLIGMGAIVLDGAVIGAESIVAAGALVTGGFECPPGSMLMGRPAKVTRELSAEERGIGRHLAEKYLAVARAHAARLGKEEAAVSCKG
jgi:gamma-carbonic anhydrase